MDQQNSPNSGTAFVPAVCTQCGAQLEVDPTQEAAVCNYCGTPFIVQKAINNYEVQHATIEHVGTVNINTKSTAESFFGFLGQQMSESREVRRQERKAAKEFDRKIVITFFKFFGILVVVMMVIFILGNLLGLFPDDEESSPASETAISEVQDTDEDSFNFEGQK